MWKGIFRNYVIRGVPRQIKNTNRVHLRGELLPARQKDMPTLIAFPELLDSPDSLQKLFTPKIREFRNIWLLSYRNTHNSDHHESMTAEELAQDVIRFMNKYGITTASLLGHGFGGKVAAVTGILKYHRISSVICLDYSPMDYSNHDALLKMKEAYVKAANLNLSKLDQATVEKDIKGWNYEPRILKNLLINLTENQGALSWKSNLQVISNYLTARDKQVNLLNWPMVGLYPGKALFLYGERSQYLHQGSNTIPIYNIFPRTLGDYGRSVDHLDTGNHWLMDDSNVLKTLQRKLFEFLKWQDGVNPLLRDRSEIGKVEVPVRSRGNLFDDELPLLVEQGDPSIPKIMPKHVHHNWAFKNQ